MNVYQRGIQLISVCLLGFGIVNLLVGGIFALVCYGLSTNTTAELFGAAAANIDNAQLQAQLFLGAATVECLTGLLSILGTVFGFYAVRKPDKALPFVVVDVLLLVGMAAVFCVLVLDRNTDMSVYIAVLAPLFLLAIALVCALRIRAQLKTGELSADWYAEYKAERAAQGKKEKLGLIRVIQVIFGFCILGSLLLCTTMKSGTYAIDTAFVVHFVNLVGEGVACWLIAKRFKVTRWWVIGVSTFNIVFGTLGVLVTGTFDITERLTSCIFDIFLILYFCLSKKVRRVLTVDFSIEQQKQEIVEAWDLWRPKTWDFWRSMIIYYCLFSIVGHWMEACYCLTIKFGIMPGTYDPTSGIWRDYLNPFPVYGVGMVACALLLYPIKTKLEEKLGGLVKPLVGSYLVNTLVCAGIELALGFACNQDLSLWDYSDMFCNFMGQICLLNSCLFGAVATLMTWIVFPALQRGYIKLPPDLKKTLFVGIIAFYALVICLYVLKMAA